MPLSFRASDLSFCKFMLQSSTQLLNTKASVLYMFIGTSMAMNRKGNELVKQKTEYLLTSVESILIRTPTN